MLFIFWTIGSHFLTFKNYWTEKSTQKDEYQLKWLKRLKRKKKSLISLFLLLFLLNDLLSHFTSDYYEHFRWAQMVKKDIDWIDNNNQWTVKTSIRSMIIGRKKIFSRWSIHQAKMKTFERMDRYYWWSAWPIVSVWIHWSIANYA